MDPVISVVIPVYNADNYLSGHGMLASVQAQTYRNLEIILVDDGSADRSLELCHQHAALDDRIKVLSHANRGESVTRNVGIEAATGEYVSLVDCDDQLDADAYETMIDLAQRFNPDIVRCNYRAAKPHRARHEYGALLDRNYIRREILPSMVGIEVAPDKQLPVHCTFLYRRELLERNGGVRYDESKRKEVDHRFTVEALVAADSIVLAEQCFYAYDQRTGSHTSSYSTRFDNIMDNFALYERLLGDEYDFDSLAKVEYNISFVEECVFYVLAHEDEVDKRQEITRILSDERVRGWYARLEDPSRFSALVRRCVLARRYDAARRLFEAAYLKTRARKIAARARG